MAHRFSSGGAYDTDWYSVNSALSENSYGGVILRGFLRAADRDEFNVGHDHSFDLQQQVLQVLVAAAAVDHHANICIEGLHYPKADLGPTVVQNAIQVVQQHRSEFLERLQSLPLQLIDPLLQIVEHGSFVVITPQPLQTFFQ